MTENDKEHHEASAAREATKKSASRPSFKAFTGHFNRKRPVFARRHSVIDSLNESKRLKVILFVLGGMLTFVLAMAAWWVGSSDNSQDVRTVISTVQSMGRLETTRMTPERIFVDVQRQGSSGRQAIDGATLSLRASGEVIAGIDLTKLAEDAVTLEGRTVSIRLPSPEILTWKLNNSTTQVLDRSSGAFRQEADLDLESAARQQAEYRILHIACQAEILPRAAEDAVRLVEGIIADVDGAANLTFEIEVAPLDTQRCDRVARLMRMFD